MVHARVVLPSVSPTAGEDGTAFVPVVGTDSDQGLHQPVTGWEEVSTPAPAPADAGRTPSRGSRRSRSPSSPTPSPPSPSPLPEETRVTAAPPMPVHKPRVAVREHLRLTAPTYMLMDYVFPADTLQITYVSGERRCKAWEVAWENLACRKAKNGMSALFRLDDGAYISGVDPAQWDELNTVRRKAQASERAHAELDMFPSSVLPQRILRALPHPGALNMLNAGVIVTPPLTPSSTGGGRLHKGRIHSAGSSRPGTAPYATRARTPLGPSRPAYAVYDDGARTREARYSNSMLTFAPPVRDPSLSNTHSVEQTLTK